MLELETIFWCCLWGAENSKYRIVLFGLSGVCIFCSLPSIIRILNVLNCFREPNLLLFLALHKHNLQECLECHTNYQIKLWLLFHLPWANLERLFQGHQRLILIKFQGLSQVPHQSCMKLAKATRQIFPRYNLWSFQKNGKKITYFILEFANLSIPFDLHLSWLIVLLVGFSYSFTMFACMHIAMTDLLYSCILIFVSLLITCNLRSLLQAITLSEMLGIVVHVIWDAPSIRS